MGKIKESFLKKCHLSKKAIVSLLVIIIAFSCFLIYDNFALEIENIKVESSKTENFNGLKIAHISDYHNRKSELINSQIFRALTEGKPDIIFLTGDLIDRNKTDVNVALEFCRNLLSYAPVYYVTGNHECNVSIVDQELFDNMISSLEEMGVNVLRQSVEAIVLNNGEKLNVYGIDDPYFHCSYSYEISQTTNSLCENFTLNENEYNILLAHHPEQLPVYAEHGFDLVFSGHAHGGQGRVFNQGLIAPDQGFFPKYTGGVYKEGNTTLILSRGIGNSIAPIRIFNKSHMIFVEL